MQSDDFKTCLARARRGDNSALGQLLESIEDRLRRRARRRWPKRLHGLLHTSDVLQTTYLNVVRSIDSFRGDDAESFAAWVARVLENNLRDKARFFERSKRRDPSTNRYGNRSGDGEDVHERVADEQSPSQQVMQFEHLHLMSRAFDKLDDAQRNVLMLRLIEGREYAAIAREMGRSEGAVRMLVSRARASLALELDQLLNGN